LFGRASFRGGIHPPPEKSRTINKTIETLPPPPYVIMHMANYAGSAAKPVVTPGERVCRGQIIGQPSGPLCASVHASIAGTVTSIGDFPHPSGKLSVAIKIENDGSEETVKMPALEKHWREAAPGELLRIIADAGIVGMGGAAFPTHVKLAPPANKPVTTLIINGIDGEPFLTADTRLMLEHLEEILTGALIAKKILGSKTTILAIETPWQPAAGKIAVALKDQKFKDIHLAKLASKYPQGSEKQLIDALLKKQVPSGGTPLDRECAVLNAATAHALNNAVVNSVPLHHRVITVSGPAIRSPKNLAAPLGTPVRFILDYCEIDWAATKKIVLGGAMTGCAQPDVSVSLQKSTRGVIAFDRLVEGVRRYECINCGSCVKTCPIRLVPSQLAKLVGKDKIKEAHDWGIMDCIECGSCAYVCPAKINLVHYMQLGKYRISGKNPVEYRS
jgi:electron transport complex protein RnfC